MKQLPCWLCLTILMVTISACTKQTQGGVAVIESPCSLPCWQNITPALTKAEDLEDLLKAVPDINTSEIKQLPAWNIFDEIYHFTFTDRATEGEIYIIEEVVDRIYINGDLHVSIDQIIQLYGNPEKVIVNSTIVPGFFGGDGVVLIIYLVYIQKGVAFSFINSDLDLITIKPDVLIERAISAKPETIVRIISPDEKPIELLEQQGRAFDWNGYQEIKYNPKK